MIASTRSSLLLTPTTTRQLTNNKCNNNSTTKKKKMIISGINLCRFNSNNNSSNNSVTTKTEMNEALRNNNINNINNIRRMRRRISNKSMIEMKATPSKTAESSSKPRLPAMDSVRFFLIAYIAIGHFIACAGQPTNALLMKLSSQVNVVVGAFFVLSGYVAAYTATELNKYEHTEKRFLPTKVAYTIQRVMGYYPLYFITQIAFMPIFLLADVTYNGWMKSFLHGLMTFSLSQAWFPAHAELWNAPTWFLSALTFAFVCIPYALPSIAKLNRKGLQRLFWKLILLTFLVKFAYCYDSNGFTFFEGLMQPKAHPSWLFWNSVRFSPLFSTIDVFIGAVSARLVMIDGIEPPPFINNKSFLLKPIVPLLLMVSLIVSRGYSLFAMSDAIARCVFVPLFAWFTMNIHRETTTTTTANNDDKFSLSNILSWKPLTYLGAISFPIYILHGPIGQIFYKRVVANKLFGFVFTSKPEFFPVWIGIVLISSAIVNETFVKNKKVAEISKTVTNKLIALSSSSTASNN